MIGTYLKLLYILSVLLNAALPCLSFSDVKILSVVQMRWDFSSCGKTGRSGPKQVDCNKSYLGTSLNNQVKVMKGIQSWTAPTSGLYIFTVRAPSGTASRESRSGRGAVLTAEFRLVQGDVLDILVGQPSDYQLVSNTARGSGGSGGTFVIRQKDKYVMLIAGGGSSAAGYNPSPFYSNQSDASFAEGGNSGSDFFYLSTPMATGGQNGKGGLRGTNGLLSSSGGGAGLFQDGETSFLKTGALPDLNTPQPAVAFDSGGIDDYGPGVGGFFSFAQNGIVYLNNGGFGGGGSGSYDGGSGGGGGFSGGSGGPRVGWGGGAGSKNNGETKVSYQLQYGVGSVTISYIGQTCCGPYVVYSAMSFIAGILLASFVVFAAIKVNKLKTKKTSNMSF